MGRRSWTDEQLIEAVKTSKTKREVIKKLGLSEGGSYRVLTKYINKLNLDTSHFLKKSEILQKARQYLPKMTDEVLFSINEIYDTKYLKKRILEKGLLPYECEICKISNWLGEYLSLHLDHKNGKRLDNRLENLRFLCPNCHSQTDTYCGKNLRHKPNICTCGKRIHRASVTCRSCVIKDTKIKWPSVEKIKKELENKSWKQLGRELGVSDNAIRKHLRSHKINLPRIKSVPHI